MCKCWTWRLEYQRTKKLCVVEFWRCGFREKIVMSFFKRVSVLIAVVVLSGCTACTVNTSDVSEKLLPDTSNLSMPENENSGGSIAPTDDTIIDDSLKLSEADFIVEYSDFKITSETTLDELIEAFGHGNEEEYEINNYGYINTIENMQIFGLYYPDYENTAIRVIYHRNLSDDSAYIAAIEIYDGSARGLMVGDKQQKVIELYGTPDKKIIDGVLCKYLYFLDEKYLEIAMIDNETEVFYIIINYQSGFEGLD